jgi:hypothetical protein
MTVDSNRMGEIEVSEDRFEPYVRHWFSAASFVWEPSGRRGTFGASKAGLAKMPNPAAYCEVPSR